MRNAFTLIELVLVILVIGIIALMAMPKFMNITKKAKSASDDAVIGSIKSAIHLKHMQNTVDSPGTDPDMCWPSENPFLLLASAPPNTLYTAPGADNVTWKAFHNSTLKAWYLMCPHYDGTYDAHGPEATKGRFYVYVYENGAYWDHSTGDLWLYRDME